MKLAACALFISALAAASPVNTTDSTVTTTVSTTQTFYTTLWQNCTAAVPASAANFTGTYSGANSSTSSIPSATALSQAYSSTSEDTTVFTTLFITLTESTAPTTATPSSSEEILTTTITTNEARATTGTLYAGDGTWYYTGLGACGWVNTDNDYIVAIGHGLFDQYTPGTNPNENTLCGKKIRAYYQGKSVEVTAVDRCEGCKPYDIDFSPAAFSQLADQSVGRIKITWEWI
ncbi:hypothetical protein OXX59_003375 [Metschnikowia pulcherrima]